MDLFLLSKNYIYSGNINVFSQDLLPSSEVLANLETSHWFLGVFVVVFFSLIFIPNIPGLVICSKRSSYQSKLLVFSTHPKPSSFPNQRPQQVGR